MITGKAVRLTAFEKRHLEKTRTWVNREDLAGFLDRARPVSEHEHSLWYENIIERQDCLFFAVETLPAEIAPVHIGNVWLWNIDTRHRKAELRVLIGEANGQNKGLGTEAISLLSQFAFKRMNLHKVYAYVLETNPRARKSFEKAGYLLEGELKQDRWQDDRYIDVALLSCLAPASK